MSVDFHKHCQKTVLSANGTGNQNGATWSVIENLQPLLTNLPSGWIENFKQNKSNITQDFAATLKIINSMNDNVVHKVYNETIDDVKTFLNGIIVKDAQFNTITDQDAPQAFYCFQVKDKTDRNIIQEHFGDGRNFKICRELWRYGAENKSCRTLFTDIISKDEDGTFHAFLNYDFSSEGGYTQIVNDSLSKADDTYLSKVIPTKGWVNNPETATNVVHRRGDEQIDGHKVFKASDDASDKTPNPTVIIGKSDKAHLELDPNEIICRSKNGNATNEQIGTHTHDEKTDLLTYANIGRYISKLYITGSNIYLNAGGEDVDAGLPNGEYPMNGNVYLKHSPIDTATGHEVVDAAWVRKVIQVDDSTIVKQYVSSTGDDNNDGKTYNKPKKTIDKAMDVLNKYRISSATGLNISLYFNDGIYDIYTTNTTRYRPIIAHPDAVNQNNMLISGVTPMSYVGGKPTIHSGIKTSIPTNAYEWYLFLHTIETNLIIQDIKLIGFTNGAQNSTRVALWSQFTLIELGNVEILRGFSALLNPVKNPDRLALYNYVAFSNISLNIGNNSDIVFWAAGSGRVDITGRSQIDSETEFNPIEPSTAKNGVAKLVLKDISHIGYATNNFSFHLGSPNHDKAFRCDVVLDNVTCEISKTFGGKKMYDGQSGVNGSEYYCHFYCINGTDISKVFPNVKASHYNKIYDYAPSWYNPNWDVVS